MDNRDIGIVGNLPYPLTIIRDRYHGTYSGGEWVAWNCEPQAIPEAASGGDCETSEFWCQVVDGVYLSLGASAEIYVARAGTIVEAIEKLKAIIHGKA